MTDKPIDFRKASEALRLIADEIDSGSCGEIRMVSVITEGKGITVYGQGMSAEGGSLRLALKAVAPFKSWLHKLLEEDAAV